MALAVLGFFQGILTTRSLGPDLYGVWGVILASAATVRSFIGAPTALPLTRFLVSYREAGETDRLALLLASTLLLDFALCFASMLTLFALAPLLAHGIAGGGAMVPVYWVCAVGQVFDFSLATWTSVMRDGRRFDLLGAVPAAAGALQLALIASLYFAHRLTLPLLAGSFLVAQIVRCIATLGLIRTAIRGYGLRLGRLPYRHVWHRRLELSEMWRFTGSMYLSTCVSSLVKNGDVLVLGAFRSDTEVGYYRLGKTVVSMFTKLGGALAQTIYQDFNELLAKRRRDSLAEGLATVARRWLPLVAAGVALATLLAEPVIRHFYTPAFVPAVPYFRVLLVGGVSNLTMFWAPTLLLALGEHRFYLHALTGSALASLVVMILAAWLVGGLGMSIVVSMMWWLILGIMAVRALRLLRSGQPAEGEAVDEADLAGAVGDPAGGVGV